MLKWLTTQVYYDTELITSVKVFKVQAPDVLIPIIGLYHPLDGITNVKYKLLCFLTPNKKNFEEKGTSS